MGPIVSVLIPTYNRADLLYKAVRSVLTQTYRNIELVITDNSQSPDAKNALSKIDDPRVKYYQNNTNIGPILNWRRAIELSTGELCVILPDDDYFINPFYIEDAVNLLSCEDINLVIPECVISYPSRNTISTTGFSGAINGQEFIRKGLHIPHIGNVFRKKCAIELNAFHSNDILWSDIEFWMKLLSTSNAYCYNRPGALYLFHSDNIVFNMNNDSLVENSKFIRTSINSFADEKLIRTAIYRYLVVIDSIYRVVGYRFIRAVFMINDSPVFVPSIFIKLRLRRLHVYVINFLKKHILRVSI